MVAAGLAVEGCRLSGLSDCWIFGWVDGSTARSGSGQLDMAMQWLIKEDAATTSTLTAIRNIGNEYPRQGEENVLFKNVQGFHVVPGPHLNSGDNDHGRPPECNGRTQAISNVNLEYESKIEEDKIHAA